MRVDPCLNNLSPACNGLLRFTSGTIPADLLATSMVTHPFWSTYLETTHICGSKKFSCVNSKNSNSKLLFKHLFLNICVMVKLSGDLANQEHRYMTTISQESSIISLVSWLWFGWAHNSLTTGGSCLYDYLSLYTLHTGHATSTLVTQEGSPTLSESDHPIWVP